MSSLITYSSLKNIALEIIFIFRPLILKVIFPGLFLNFFLMDDEGPYFSAVMSSPSDDGQCTDTDKDEESGDRVEQHTPEGD